MRDHRLACYLGRTGCDCIDDGAVFDDILLRHTGQLSHQTLAISSDLAG